MPPDGGGYSTCSSPFATDPLPDGPHTFEVRATDEAPTPTQPRLAQLHGRHHPPGDLDRLRPRRGLEHQRQHPDLRLLLERAGRELECRLDTDSFAACLGPGAKSHTPPAPLPDGPHSFEVRATDKAANTEPSPATRSFTVDTQPPQAKVSQKGKPKVGKPIAIAVSCTEDCVVVASGKVLVWGSPRRRTGAHAPRPPPQGEVRAEKGHQATQRGPGRHAEAGTEEQEGEAQAEAGCQERQEGEGRDQGQLLRPPREHEHREADDHAAEEVDGRGSMQGPPPGLGSLYPQ